MCERGFSLLEVLVALSILLGVLTGLAQLFATTSRVTNDARRAAVASVLAAQKLEQLRGLGGELALLSVGSLRRNVDGLCDFIDEQGRRLGGGTRPPEGTVFTRRWAVESLPSDPASTFILRVAVVPRMWRGSLNVDAGDPRLIGGAELVTVTTRLVQ